MNKCTSYGPDKLNLWPFYHLTFKCDLDLQPTWTNVSNGTSPSRRQQLCKILKSMHKCTNYGPDKLNLWPFWPLFDPCDLDLNLPKKMFKWHSGGTTVQNYFEIHALLYKLWPGQAQYMTILTFIWPLWLWPSTYLKMFHIALLLLKSNKCAKLLWNPCIIIQVMVRTNPDGCTDVRTCTEQKL